MRYCTAVEYFPREWEDDINARTRTISRIQNEIEGVAVQHNYWKNLAITNHIRILLSDHIANQ